MIDIVINITLLAFLVITAVAILRITNLFAIIMLFGVFSFTSAGLFVVMDAADVAFTEAAVGAGISTILMLATLALIKGQTEKRPLGHRPWLPMAVVSMTGAALVYGTLDIPSFGDPNSPVQTHVGPYYIEKSISDTGVPNMVTAVLASYRGFDTLGETAVIFTAGVAVLILIGGRRSRQRKNTDADNNSPNNSNKANSDAEIASSESSSTYSRTEKQVPDVNQTVNHTSSNNHSASGQSLAREKTDEA